MIPVGEGPVETLVVPSDHQNERTHIFALPRELLVLIFKTQSSITDAVHLAGTCHYLRNLYKSEHTIASTVLQREIPCYEKALRLAEAQVTNLQLRHSDALTSKLYLNAKDAARVCRLASLNFTSKPPLVLVTPCPIHGGGGQREILPHERTRILHSWYFLKLYAESLRALGQPQYQSLTKELWAVSALQAYVLWSMVIWVCEGMDETAQEVRISLPISCAHRLVLSFIRLPSSFKKRYLLECVQPRHFEQHFAVYCQ